MPTPIRFSVPDHLIVPFACHKFSIDKIKLTGVSTKGTFFESETPCAHIDMSDKRPLRLFDAERVMGCWTETPWHEHPNAGDDTKTGLEAIRNLLLTFGELDTDAEKAFVNSYFSWLWKYRKHYRFRAKTRKAKHPDESDWLFDALLPLPQAHIYCRDPLTGGYGFTPERMFKLDFLFWTGEQLVAIEIDGKSHIGSDTHIVKDRLLQRAGVTVIHITNHEVFEFGEVAVERLLPASVTDFDLDGAPVSPWQDIYF